MAFCKPILKKKIIKRYKRFLQLLQEISILVESGWTGKEAHQQVNNKMKVIKEIVLKRNREEGEHNL